MNEFGVSQRLKENYDSYYLGESEWRTLGSIDKVTNIISLCGALPHSKILEIGSGDGAILKRLSDLNFGDALYSVEISDSAIATIHRRTIPRVQECRSFDGYHIPYEDRRFDLAVLSHVLEHVEHPRMLLYEASRVAKHVFVEVPLEHTIWLKPDFIFDRVGHINFYSYCTITRLIQSCELKILARAVTNPSLSVYKYCSGRNGIFKHLVKEILMRMSTTMACKLFTYHFAVLCSQ